jgi:outer membrane autotransporter protein
LSGIAGGAGGAGGGATAGGTAGNPGAGGAGIIGSGLTVINRGTIAGGLAGDGVTRANAITFTGGSNVLTLNGGSLIGNIDVTGTLTFNQTVAATLANVITGTGAVVQAGSGTLTLTGASTYTGGTTINSGRLNVDGSLAGAVAINAGGILGGTGRVGTVTVNAGGILSPGHSPGTLTVTSLTFNPGAIYAVDVTPSTASRTNVIGAATLTGTVQATFLPGTYTPRSYTILSTGTGMILSPLPGGRTGTFSAVTSSTPFLSASLSYTATDVLLNVGFNTAPTLPGLNTNQQSVLTDLGQAFAATGGAGAFGDLLSLTNDQLSAALTSLSGEIGTGVQNPSFAMGGAFFNAIAGQMQSWRNGGTGGPSQGNAAYRVELASAQSGIELAQAVPGGGLWPPPPSAERRFAVWAQGFGLSGGRDGDAGVGSARLSYAMGGGASGFDVQLAPGLLVGASVAAAGSGFSLQGQPANGTARTIFFGLYGAWTMGSLYVDAAAGYGHGTFTTTRTITVGATSEFAEGDFDGHQYGGSVEAGWRFDVARYRLTPFAGVAVQALHQNPYSETSRNTATNLSGTLGLSYQGETTTSVRSFLGGEAATTLRLDERTTLMPRIRLAWAHEFDRDRQVSASFLSLPGAAFTVSGARPASDSAIVVAGADLALGRNVALFAQFDGDIAGGGGNAYAGSGGIRISW